MNRIILLAALAVPMVLTVDVAAARGTKPVKTGAVIRGVTLPPPVGASGTSTGMPCDFSGDPVDPQGGSPIPVSIAGPAARFSKT